MDGYGLFAIAERLTRNGIPCPSAHDPGRNPHRSGIAWSKSAIRAISTDPRYVGHQVWNRQSKDEVLLPMPIPRGVRPGQPRHASPQRLPERGSRRPATRPPARPVVRAAQCRPDPRRSDRRAGPGSARGPSSRGGTPPDHGVRP
ncbi:recombinase family protein [Nonomuraea sp. NPDC050643]|uniref:recombinase family protein n=1 Tax=Nonomuraea sp. NPDC050643 TaxID=3155660 RepID=UPI0033DC24AE